MICYEYLGLLFTSYYLLVGWWSSEMTVGELCLVEASELVTCGCLRLFCIFCSIFYFSCPLLSSEHALLLTSWSFFWSPYLFCEQSLTLCMNVCVPLFFFWRTRSRCGWMCMCSFVIFTRSGVLITHACSFFFFVLARAVYECVCSFFLRARARYQYMSVPLFFLFGQSRALFMHVWVLSLFIYLLLCERVIYKSVLI